MKTVIITVSLLLATTAAFAADPPPQGQGQNFENFKANVISRINARIARNQEELSCVQSAKDHNALKECRQKFAQELKAEREQMKSRRPQMRGQQQ